VNIDNGKVILVPGPRKEVETVREIYRLAISEKKAHMQLLKSLIADG
jgi:hypothetical protein